MQAAVAEDCGCYWPGLYLPSPSDTFTFNTSACDLTANSSDTACYQHTMHQFDSLTRSCPCEVGCEERDFLGRVTLSTWPSNQVLFCIGREIYLLAGTPQYWEYLALDLGHTAAEISEPRLGVKQEIQQDYTRAEIYYQTLNIQAIHQKPKFDVSKSVWNISYNETFCS